MSIHQTSYCFGVIVSGFIAGYKIFYMRDYQNGLAIDSIESVIQNA